jgi:cardiolipin synthase
VPRDKAGSEPPTLLSGLWTWPNLITALRLACLPVFVWVLFGLENRHIAAWMLGGLGATDWVDGYVARRLNQTSEFGKVFDPTVDRLLFFVGIVSLIIDGSAPVWFSIAVLVREVLVGATMVIATVAFSMERFDVTWWGKTATFLLMFAFPGFLMGASNMPIASAFEVAAWILGPPGLILSWYTAVAYVPAVRAGIRSGRSH